MFGKNEDRVIDNLLRASMRGRGGPDPACREFDPDLANAYIERSLPAKERTGYERHLFECHACRSGVAALSRMVEAEAAPVVAALSVREPSRFRAFKGLFTPSAMPRVAAAALAVVVLAVSIPLLFSREDRAPSDQNAYSEIAREQKAKVAEDQPPSPGSPLPSSLGVLNSGTAQPAQDGEAKARTVSREEEQTPPPGETATAKQQPAEPEAVQSGAGVARVEPPQPGKLEAKNAVESSDQARKVESDAQVVAREQTAPPPPPPAADAPVALGRINPEDARRLKQQDKDAVSVTIKPGNVGGVSDVGKEERTTIRPTDAVAPASSAASGERRGLAEPSPRARRDEANTGGAAFAPRGSATRKVGNKKFWLSKDTWTDKDYNPNKEMPVVTIERNSDIYKELLTKRSGLKLYLMGFGEGERAIFVYKGTVYRLVPQTSR
ncbi:MAG TPA: zf-HC2 domain-containing protein [Blastocatellia bacterium]|nr:zf-HC2 domain-containing protein [Blastocatellia bacterium]